MKKGQRLLLLTPHLYELVLNRNQGPGVLFLHLLDTCPDVSGQVSIAARNFFETVEEDVVNQVSADSEGDIPVHLACPLRVTSQCLPHIFGMLASSNV